LDNGLKVGPNYCRPPAPVAEHWIDAARPADNGDAAGAAKPKVLEVSEDLTAWWSVFNDPVLDRLIADAYRQNLTLREAGFRVLEARAQLGIARGGFFPQQQFAQGAYTRQGGRAGFFDQWNFGFGLAWELDFWGRFRRAIEAADDQLDASVEGYDYVLVTLLGDVASNYVQVRTDQEQIALLEIIVKFQKDVRDVAQDQLQKGARNVTAVDLNQAESNLQQTQAQIAQLKIDLRQANNRLCILLGTPPVELWNSVDVWKSEDQRKAAELNQWRNELYTLLDTGDLGKTEVIKKIEGLWDAISSLYIPTAAQDVAAGIPADLLRRRPDVRQAERLAAAQAEQIGIAEADLYPAFSIHGTLGYQANKLSQLFTSGGFNGTFGPSFQWDLLNYGRIVNNVRLQDARFQELVVNYQDTVLRAASEVENGLVTFLQSQERAELLRGSAQAGRRAAVVAGRLVREAPQAVGFPFNQAAVILQTLVQQENSWAQARGNIAQGLIQVYRGLGGGWQIRLAPQ
jgi:outer membrane protein TolC